MTFDMTTAVDRLLDAIDEKKNPSVVGLDPRLEMIPEHLIEEAKKEGVEVFEKVHNAIVKFNHDIIDSVADVVPAVKPQIAFYEQYGRWGVRAYEDTILYAKKKGLSVIGDVKRNDIGSTATAYADGHIGMVQNLELSRVSSYSTDMITVNPYLGTDGIKPFMDVCSEQGRGIFVLVKTSNPSSGEIQDRRLESGETVSEAVAKLVHSWGKDIVGDRGYSSVGAVVGATYPKECARLRELMPGSLILVPGYGAQGGTASDIIPAFQDDGYGALVNSSRGIIHAYANERYADHGPEEHGSAAKAAAVDMRDDITHALESAGKLPSGW